MSLVPKSNTVNQFNKTRSLKWKKNYIRGKLTRFRQSKPILSLFLKESKVCIYGSSCHAIDPRRSQIPDAHFRLKSQEQLGQTTPEHMEKLRSHGQDSFPQDKLEKGKPN